MSGDPKGRPNGEASATNDAITLESDDDDESED
jgi:hypothetical protein